MSIITIRGTNGSGKTTAVRSLMKVMTPVKQFRTSNGVLADLYRYGEKNVVIIGGYPEGTATGGVDRVKNVRDIVPACQELAPFASVVMEGLVLSGLQQITQDIVDACPGTPVYNLFLKTTFDECVASTLKRRAAVGNEKPFDPEKTMRPKYRACELAYMKFKSWGLHAEGVSREEVVNRVLELI